MKNIFLSLSMIVLLFSCKTTKTYHIEYNKNGDEKIVLNGGFNEIGAIPILINEIPYKNGKKVIRKENKFIFENYQFPIFLKDTVYIKNNIKYHLVYIKTEFNDTVEFYFNIQYKIK